MIPVYGNINTYRVVRKKINTPSISVNHGNSTARDGSISSSSFDVSLLSFSSSSCSLLALSVVYIDVISFYIKGFACEEESYETSNIIVLTSTP